MIILSFFLFTVRSACILCFFCLLKMAGPCGMIRWLDAHFLFVKREISLTPLEKKMGLAAETLAKGIHNDNKRTCLEWKKIVNLFIKHLFK